MTGVVLRAYPANMPGYNSNIDLDEVQSLASDNSFPPYSTTATGALFSFHPETTADLLNVPQWCVPREGSQYLTDFPDNNSPRVGDAEYIFTSGQTTPKGTRTDQTQHAVDASWNVSTRTMPPASRGQNMSRADSTQSSQSSLSHSSHISLGASTRQNANAIPSPICWPGYELDQGLGADYSLTVDDLESLNVAPAQMNLGQGNAMVGNTTPSSWDDFSSCISRTSSPATNDETWMSAALNVNSPADYLSASTSDRNPSGLSDGLRGTISPLSDASVVSGTFQHRQNNEPESPRDDHRYKNAVRQSDGLFHCPWEGKPGCNHKPEKLKCNYDKFVDSHLKPYRCKVKSCQGAQFSSTACRLRHEREAHGLHGHGNKPFLCPYEGCERAHPGSGFPRQWNLRDHMKRVHNDSGVGASPEPTVVQPAKGRKRKMDSSEADCNERKVAQKTMLPVEPKPDPAKPLIDEWLEHHRNLQNLLQGIFPPGDTRNLESISEMQKRASDMVKINMELNAISNATSQPVPGHELFNDGD